jgi:hypothetical protein
LSILYEESCNLCSRLYPQARRAKDNKITLTFDPLFILKSNLNLKITAISIKLNAYYYYPLSSKLNFRLNTGTGYYFGKINYSMKMDESIFEISSFRTFSSSRNKNQLLNKGTQSIVSP